MGIIPPHVLQCTRGYLCLIRSVTRFHPDTLIHSCITSSSSETNTSSRDGVFSLLDRHSAVLLTAIPPLRSSAARVA